MVGNPHSPGRIHKVTNLEQMERFARWLAGTSGRPVAVDLETPSLDPYRDEHPRIICASVAGPDRTWAIALAHEAARYPDSWKIQARRLAELLQGRPLVGANLKFDFRWFWATTGVDLSPDLGWDVIPVDALEDEERSHSLKDIAVRLLGVAPWAIDVRRAWEIPWERLSEYAGLDARYSYDVYKAQIGRLPQDKDNLRKFLFRSLTQLGYIERRGLLLDLDRLRETRVEKEAEALELYRQLTLTVPEHLWAKYGGQINMLTGLPDVSFNSGSHFFQDYAENRWPLIECTASCSCQGGDKEHPNPSWNKRVLKQLSEEGYPAAGLLLEWRALEKTLGTYLRGWEDQAGDEGRIHTDFAVHKTVTGRLASSDPNLQNVPRKSKRCFTAPELFINADYSQLEVRVMAHLSGDEALADACLSSDIYTDVAARLNNIDPHQVTPDQRQRTKPIVLGFMYGLSVWGFMASAKYQYGLEFSESQAHNIRERFFAAYTGLGRYHAQIEHDLRFQGYVSAPHGRTRSPSGPSGGETGFQRALRQAMNAPTQGLASDITLSAVCELSAYPSEDFHGVGLVHDSGMLEARERSLEDTLDVVEKIMLNPWVPNLGRVQAWMDVPLEIEVEIGPHWSEPYETRVYRA